MSIELHKIYKRKKSDRDIFQELMPFKIKEILLIANYYDAYTIEREGQFTDKIVGEYLQVNLYTAPRFTSVASEAEALKILSERHIDLIILMAGLDKQTPLVISRHLKDLYPNICQLMLVNNNSDLAYFHTIEDRLYESIERLFVWNGSTKIFLVMAKYIEDKMNLDRDTHLGDIRVILLVENSIRYYSRYLPLLYTEVMTQTQELIFSEPQDNDMSIVMKIRVRPKVILATNYEEAVYVIDHYRENLIGVISDVRYKRNGEEDEEAGIELIRYVKRTGAYIPCMLQSQEIENAVKAEELHVFIGSLLTNGWGGPQSFQIAMTNCCAVAVALFGGYFLAAYAINEMGIKMFGMHANMPLVQQFAGYALVVPFLLQIVTGLLPDFRIIAWLLQFYIVYVVWEGAPIMMKVEEKQRLKYTLLSSVLLILCPTVIQFVFNKLTAILN